MKRLTLSSIVLLSILVIGCELTPDQQATFNQAPVILAESAATMEAGIARLEAEGAPAEKIAAARKALSNVKKAQSAVDASTDDAGNFDPATGIGSAALGLLGPYAPIGAAALFAFRSWQQKSRTKSIVAGVEKLKATVPAVAEAFKSVEGQVALGSMGTSAKNAVLAAKGEKFALPV